VKQIAGRAGRYRTADQASKSDSDSSTGIDSPVEVVLPPAENLGLVTVFDPDDLDFVRKSMLAKVSPLQTAGLIASNEMITRFSARFPPEVPLSYLLVRLQELMRLPQNGKFHMCSLRSQVQIADSIQHIKGLSLTDRLEFIAAPADSRNDAAFEKMLIACAELVAGEREGDLLEMEEYNLELLDQEPMPDKAMLPKLEHLHRGLVLYLWLSFRFSSYFKCRAIANHAKQLVEKRIENQLALLSLSRRLIRKCTAPDKDSDLERRGLEAVRPLIRTIPYESKSKRPTLRTVESARRGPTSSSLHQHLLLS
jgi:ATP-dependent RNA helicase SUPV3L1/SUV3